MVLGWALSCSYDPSLEPSEPPRATQGEESPVSPPPVATDPGGPTVAVHPDVATVLVVSWDQPAGVDRAWLEWTVDGVSSSSPPRSVPPGRASEVVLGVPALTRVDDLRIRLDDAVVTLGSASTGALPPELDEPTRTASGARTAPWLLTSLDVGPNAFYGPCYTVVLDRDGRIVWYRPSEGSRLTWQTRLSRAGDALLVDEVLTYAFDDPGVANVRRVTLDLEVDERIELPGMITFDELDDGGFVYAAARSGLEFDLVRRHPDGTESTVWSCFPWMAPWNDESWGCATNTTSWSPERGTVLWSTFVTDIVLEIDLETGAIVGEYGPYPGGADFEPPESAFVEPHGPGWTTAGTLLVSTHDADHTAQLAREFEVDGVVREIRTIEATAWAAYGGQIRALPDGNLLWSLGTAGLLQELAPDGEVLWEVDSGGKLFGNVTPIADLYDLTR